MSLSVKKVQQSLAAINPDFGSGMFALNNAILPLGQHLYARHVLLPDDPIHHDDNGSYITQKSDTEDAMMRTVYFVDERDDGNEFNFDNPEHKRAYINAKHLINKYNEQRSEGSLLGEVSQGTRILILLSLKPKCEEMPRYVCCVYGTEEALTEFRNASYAFSGCSINMNNYNVLGIQVI